MHSGIADPVDDNLLQMMDIITSGIVSSSVELYRPVRMSTIIQFVPSYLMIIIEKFVVMELNSLVVEVWNKLVKGKI